MNKVLSTIGINYLARKMEGKKTYFAAGVLMLLGAAQICISAAGLIGNMYQDVGAPVVDMDQAFTGLREGAAMFGAGLGFLGIGRKIQKSNGGE